MHVVEEQQVGPLLVQVVHDEDAESPRKDYDNVGLLYCWHKRYDLGDKHDITSDMADSWEEMEALLIEEEDLKDGVILPVYMMDHSGLSLSCSPFSCPWDSGQVGFIFCNKERWAKECGAKWDVKAVEKMLISEIETYSSYLEGSAWGYIIEHEGETVESVWGFIGSSDYCLSEGVSEAKAIAEDVDYRMNKSWSF